MTATAAQIAQITAALEACDTDDEIGPGVTVDPSDATTLPSAPVFPHVKQCLYDATGNLVGIVDSTGSHLINVPGDDEIGPSVTVDLDDATTFPATPVSPHEKQCLIDADGNMVGFVDEDGVHLIIEKDELGPAVVVDTADSTTFPSAPVAPHEKQCLVDAAGNAVGFVDSTGSHIYVDNYVTRETVAAGETIATENGDALEGDQVLTFTDGSKVCIPSKDRIAAIAAECFTDAIVAAVAAK